MPHLQLQYSDNLASRIDFAQLCRDLNSTLADTQLFPVGGIRVRAIPVAVYSIADNHEENSFLDAVLRIGVGRSKEQKNMVGKRLMEKLEAKCAELLATPHFALSLEIVEIDPEFSWKTNSIHPRLKNQPK